MAPRRSVQCPRTNQAKSCFDPDATLPRCITKDNLTLHSSRLPDPKIPKVPDPKAARPLHKEQSGSPSLESGHQPGWLAHLSGSASFFGGFLPNLRPWGQQSAGAARFGLSLKSCHVPAGLPGLEGLWVFVVLQPVHSTSRIPGQAATAAPPNASP